ncbi:hypothetical protein J4437_06945 [Candidatus Woesearchaeota archaeon]|nr:hypothetical protein [Candidatus Woesearchaeota archaeon]
MVQVVKWSLVLGSLLFLVITLFSITVLSLNDKQIPAAIFGGKELPSPGDWVEEKQIKVYDQQIILNVKNATWAKFTDTNSMDPFIDEKSNAIQIRPKNPEMINIGDVISYHTAYGTIIHRVVEKGKDEEGLYFTVKGDNNRYADAVKVRFEDVVGVVVAVVY